MATTTSTVKVVADTTQAERALGSLNSTLKTLISVGASVALAKTFIGIADAATNMENKLRQVIATGQTSAELFGLIAKTANSLGATMGDVGDLFYRIGLNTQDLGLKQSEQLRITELLIKGFQLTGASAAETNGAVIQLGQAFGQGTLRGDELRSVMEGLPLVAQALADKFGVQRGALKALGEAGKISSQDLSDAILASGTALDQAYTQRIPTIQQAFNILSNTIQTLANDTNNATGINEALSRAILILANGVVTVTKFFIEHAEAVKKVIQVIGALIALSAAGRVFKLLSGAVQGAIGVFNIFRGGVASLSRTFEFITNNTKRFLGGFISLDIYTKALIKRFGYLFDTLWKLGKAIGAIGVTAAAFLGIDKFFKRVESTTAKEQTDKLNKALGIDSVKASEDARIASEKKTAQDIKNAGIIEKANNDRNNSFADLIRNQEESLQLSGLEGAELQIQERILQANKSLVKTITDDKGNILGYTKGLTAEETKQYELLIKRQIQDRLQTELKQANKELSAELLRLDIANLDAREEQAAVDKMRLQYGELFTAELEKQTRENVKQQQLIRDTLAVEQARIALSTDMTKAESLQRGVGVTKRLNPEQDLQDEYDRDLASLQQLLDNKLISQLQYEKDLLTLKQEYADKANQIAANALQKDLDRITQRLMAERDLSQAVLTEKEKQVVRAIGDQERQRVIIQDRINWEKKSEAEKAQYAIQQGADMFNALGAQNKKAFEIAKAFNIANAIMNTYMAATKALSMYPPPFSFIAAAAAVGMGLAQVAQIRAQTYSGRALGGPMVGGQGYLVGEKGPEIFRPSTAGTMIPNNQVSGGSTNVTFNIVANDTRGFDNLLMERRPLITKIIRDAQLEQGRRQ